MDYESFGAMWTIESDVWEFAILLSIFQVLDLQYKRDKLKVLIQEKLDEQFEKEMKEIDATNFLDDYSDEYIDPFEEKHGPCWEIKSMFLQQTSKLRYNKFICSKHFYS